MVPEALAGPGSRLSGRIHRTPTTPPGARLSSKPPSSTRARMPIRALDPSVQGLQGDGVWWDIGWAERARANTGGPPVKPSSVELHAEARATVP